MSVTDRTGVSNSMVSTHRTNPGFAFSNPGCDKTQSREL